MSDIINSFGSAVTLVCVAKDFNISIVEFDELSD